MTYTVHSIFKTLQGEGSYTGRVAIFVRFAGCNLWTGREKDRAKAVCKFCDTEFVGGKRYNDPESLVAAISAVWGTQIRGRLVVLTGGEPLLQVDEALIAALTQAHFRINVESNGTVMAPDKIQHLVVSPKAGSKIIQNYADELKFVYPQKGMTPEQAMELVTAPINCLQPMDGRHRKANVRSAIEYCKARPWWRLSLQTHKMIGIP